MYVSEDAGRLLDSLERYSNNVRFLAGGFMMVVASLLSGRCYAGEILLDYGNGGWV